MEKIFQAELSRCKGSIQEGTQGTKYKVANEAETSRWRHRAVGYWAFGGMLHFVCHAECKEKQSLLNKGDT